MVNRKNSIGVSKLGTWQRPAYETLGLRRGALVLLCCAITLHYILWRAGTFNGQALIFSTILFAAECFGLMMMAIHYLTIFRLSIRTPRAPMQGRSVDVFIPTINESVATVRRTALAALAMDYPHTTWILDDGRRAEIKQLAAELGCGYITRTGNAHAKAGNLNHALAKTTGEFIAFFDADHAPKQTFLTRTLGYFSDPLVAFVQTPQEFYNLDSYQHRLDRNTGRMWTEQSLFFRVIQRGKDAWNAAFFCGSCAIMRRSALEAVGGFAVGTVAEDLHTSIVLHKAGYSSVYHDEPLAFGIAAAQINVFFKQRMRWGQGAMQIWRRENVLLGSGLTLMQRILYFASIATYFTGWQKLVFYMCPPIVLLTGMLPISADGKDFLSYFLPFMVISMLTFSETSRGYGRAWYSEQYNMTSFAAWAWACIGYFKKNLRFIVTSKHISTVPDYWRFLMPQALIIGLSLIAACVGLWRFSQGTSSLDGIALTSNLMWTAYSVFFAALAIRFALARASYRREDYRFHMLLVAAFTDSKGLEHHATVRDISATGLCLYLSKPASVAIGERITGTLWLPDGTLPFTCETCAVTNNGNRIGARFLWEGAEKSCYRLETFLYGTDHEWRLHAITDRTPTMMEYLLSLWKRIRRPFADTQRAASHSMLYTSTNRPTGAPLPGVIYMNAKQPHAQIMLYAPLTGNASLEARIFTDKGWKNFTARIANENKAEAKNKVDTGGASFYNCELEESLA